MDRRNFIKSSALAAAGAVVATSAIAQTGTTAAAGSSGGSAHVGKLTMAEFAKLNKEGAATVKAVSPTSAALSKADEALMLKVAEGGMMQLEASRLAVKNATTPDVRAYAEAEVEEQTLIKTKLMETAKAKGMTMPEVPMARIEAMLARLSKQTGAEFDGLYMREAGIEGHETLDKTLKQVESSAQDAGMKALAMAAHPLVLAHLKVARDEVADRAGGNPRSS